MVSFFAIVHIFPYPSKATFEPLWRLCKKSILKNDTISIDFLHNPQEKLCLGWVKASAFGLLIVDNTSRNRLCKKSIENYDFDLSCYFYFIDADLQKNRNYYEEEIQKMRHAYNLDIQICYGEELFIKESITEAWNDEIIDFLKEWREELPDLPEINFDLNHHETFEEIKQLQPLYFRKLFDNEEILERIFPIIFPQNETLKLLAEHFKEKSLHRNRQQQIYNYLYTKVATLI